MSSDEAVVDLWSLAAGESCQVADFASDLPEAYRIRLMELGFHPGETIACLQIPPWGAPRVYRVSNTVYSLDRDIASSVHVKALAASPRLP